jgi:hypothetical protein
LIVLRLTACCSANSRAVVPARYCSTTAAVPSKARRSAVVRRPWPEMWGSDKSRFVCLIVFFDAPQHADQRFYEVLAVRVAAE